MQRYPNETVTKQYKTVTNIKIRFRSLKIKKQSAVSVLPLVNFKEDENLTSLHGTLN